MSLKVEREIVEKLAKQLTESMETSIEDISTPSNKSHEYEALDFVCGVEKLRKMVKSFEKELSKMQTPVKDDILDHLKKNNLKELSSPSGKISYKDEFSVTLPKGEELKKFLVHLKEIGRADLVSISSSSLKKFYVDRREDAMGDGKDVSEFYVPGINPDTVTTFPKFTVTPK